MEVAASGYGYEPGYFRRLLPHGAVDVLQADATRCGGVAGFLQPAILSDVFQTDLSARCAPALHCRLGCAAPRFRHLEWFHDHVLIGRMLFDGAPVPSAGSIEPDALGQTQTSLEAVGATDIFRQENDTNHLAGTARMGFDRATSVVDTDCRSWDIPNLWVCDGSGFPTTGGVNPHLTITAIARRTADRIKKLAAAGAL